LLIRLQKEAKVERETAAVIALAVTAVETAVMMAVTARPKGNST
jgi:hypothetical protein